MHKIKKLNPQPEFIVHLGDMTSGSSNPEELEGLLEGFKKIIGSYYPIEYFYPVMGNHDAGDNQVDSLCEKVFRKVFNEFLTESQLEGYNNTVYYFSRDGKKLIVLNSMHSGEEDKISCEQLEWLKKVLNEPAGHKFLFVHSPPFPTGAHVGTCLDKYCEARDRFWSIVDSYNVDIVFSGHEHNYSRRLVDNTFNTERYRFNNRVYQVVSGGGGEKLKDKFKSKNGVVVPPINKFHFVVVDAEQNKISVEAVSIEGKVIDRFNINK